MHVKGCALFSKVWVERTPKHFAYVGIYMGYGALPEGPPPFCFWGLGDRGVGPDLTSLPRGRDSSWAVSPAQPTGHPGPIGLHSQARHIPWPGDAGLYMDQLFMN